MISSFLDENPSLRPPEPPKPPPLPPHIKKWERKLWVGRKKRKIEGLDCDDGYVNVVGYTLDKPFSRDIWCIDIEMKNGKCKSPSCFFVRLILYASILRLPFLNNNVCTSYIFSTLWGLHFENCVYSESWHCSTPEKPYAKFVHGRKRKVAMIYIWVHQVFMLNLNTFYQSWETQKDWETFSTGQKSWVLSHYSLYKLLSAYDYHAIKREAQNALKLFEKLLVKAGI